MADGGEGTVRALVDATKGRIIRKEVTGSKGAARNTEQKIFDNAIIYVI